MSILKGKRMELPIDIIIRVDAKKENDSGEYTFQCKALGELVRCRDCKYYKIAQLTKDYEPDRRCKPSCCAKDEFAVYRKPDWFCADGKRKEKTDADS